MYYNYTQVVKEYISKSSRLLHSASSPESCLTESETGKNPEPLHHTENHRHKIPRRPESCQPFFGNVARIGGKAASGHGDSDTELVQYRRQNTIVLSIGTPKKVPLIVENLHVLQLGQEIQGALRVSSSLSFSKITPQGSKYPIIILLPKTYSINTVTQNLGTWLLGTWTLREWS